MSKLTQFESILPRRKCRTGENECRSINNNYKNLLKHQNKDELTFAKTSAWLDRLIIGIAKRSK